MNSPALPKTENCSVTGYLPEEIAAVARLVYVASGWVAISHPLNVSAAATGTFLILIQYS